MPYINIFLSVGLAFSPYWEVSELIWSSYVEAVDSICVLGHLKHNLGLIELLEMMITPYCLCLDQGAPFLAAPSPPVGL
jgi:hypothetical protein